MTSNDAPAPGPGAGRRRALGRGPGTTRPDPAAPSADPRDPTGHEPAPQPRATSPETDVQPSPPRQPAPAPGHDHADTPAPALEPAERPTAGRAPGGTPAAGREATDAAAPGRQPADTPEPDRERVDTPAPEQQPGSGVREFGRGAVDAPAPEMEPADTPAPGPDPAGRPAPGREPGDPPGHGSAGTADGVDGVFKVRLANFEGPFDLLLQLISKHKLDVTEVALSKVTDEFMAHIRAMGPDWDLDQTTEFLVVAATLLDLKAARLLPTAEVEDEADLALLEARDLLFARLLQYRAYKQIADIFNRRLDEEARRYPRTVGLEPEHAELLPEVVISIGPEGFAQLAVKAMQPRPKPQVYVDHIHAPLVSVQEQAGIVVARLKELGEASFRVLVEDTDDTLTVVARFLALLELYREKAVSLEQEAALGELLVRWTGGDGEAAPRVTDEFDRPPEVPEVPEEEKKA
ncbi:segregation/condensation protein A [Streptomyces collinus]|uniref:segregation/condensation protein A n=1 Tax=Streptomyces collinus TaxID=42684 RepID=UPI00341B4941